MAMPPPLPLPRFVHLAGGLEDVLAGHGHGAGESGDPAAAFGHRVGQALAPGRDKVGPGILQHGIIIKAAAHDATSLENLSRPGQRVSSGSGVSRVQ